MRTRIAIRIEGGVITDVYCSDPTVVDIFDMDDENAGLDDYPVDEELAAHIKQHDLVEVA